MALRRFAESLSTPAENGIKWCGDVRPRLPPKKVGCPESSIPMSASARWVRAAVIKARPAEVSGWGGAWKSTSFVKRKGRYSPPFAEGIMSARHFVLRPDQHEPALNVVGTQVTVLASNTLTQSYGVTLQRGEEGTGPPPHSHDWDEAFYVLRGQISFLCDGNAYTCGAGTLVHIPRGTVHAFSYGSGGGQMLEITGAGALAAQMFAAVDSGIPAGPPDVPRLLDVLKRNGVTVAV